MTESDYIIISDRVKITAAKRILMDIVAENNKLIDIDVFKNMVKQLAIWEIEHFDEINSWDQHQHREHTAEVK
ncbi:MAG: hypothetical protein P8X74_03845 [Reinekea sp.]